MIHAYDYVSMILLLGFCWLDPHRRKHKKAKDMTAKGDETNANYTPNDSSKSTNGVLSKTEHLSISPQTIKLHHKVTILITFLCFLSSLSLLIYGFYLRVSSLHNGSECDMTYSYYKYLPIQIYSQSEYRKTPNDYRLLKFVDRQDPRFYHLYNLKTENSVQDSTRLLTIEDNWCERDTNHPVLYIPGHWGSYTQSRSLGIHGLHLTRAGMDHGSIRNIQNQLLSASHPNQTKSSPSSPFFYDVYTVDFHEQGGALHGYTMIQQTHFVYQALQTIHHACTPFYPKNLQPKITIVAHSIGGIVARAVPKLYPSSTDMIGNIITLATPHVSLPYMFDETVHNFYKLINGNFYHSLMAPEIIEGKKERESNDVFVVSISGGIRDELIPPSLCHAGLVGREQEHEDDKNEISILATTFMPPKQNQQYKKETLGMDHRAIVWCHNVLSIVREIIQSLTTYDEKMKPYGVNNTDINDSRNSEEPPPRTKKEWVGSVLKSQHIKNSAKERRKEEEIETIFHYQEEVLEQHRAFVNSYGFIKALAMKIAMPYSLSSMVGLYTVAALLDQTMAFIKRHYLGESNLLTYHTKKSQFSIFSLYSACMTSIILVLARIVALRFLNGNGSSNVTIVDIISSAILCFLALTLYFGIARGLPALVGYILQRCRKITRRKNEETNNSMPSFAACRHQKYGSVLRSLIRKQTFWFGITMLFVTGGSHSFITNIKNEEFLINKDSIMAIILLSMMMVIIVNLLFLLGNPRMPDVIKALSVLEEKEKLTSCQAELMAEYLSYRRNIAVAQLILTMPFLMIGKVVYAVSMLSSSGQIDLDLLDNFHAALGVNAGVLNHDQFRFMILCIPIFFLICNLWYTKVLGVIRNSQSEAANTQLEVLLCISGPVARRKRSAISIFATNFCLCMHVVILVSFYFSTLQVGSDHLIGIAISASSLIQLGERFLRVF